MSCQAIFDVVHSLLIYLPVKIQQLSFMLRKASSRTSDHQRASRPTTVRLDRESIMCYVSYQNREQLQPDSP